MRIFISLLLTLNCISKGFLRSDGINPSTCSNMSVSHDSFIAQEGECPFHILVSKTFVKVGGILKVVIQADEGRSFRGFHLQARSKVDGTKIIGEFLEDEKEKEKFKFRDCEAETHNAVTHFSNDLKQKISFKWKAPVNFEGEVNFRASLVENFETFWVNQLSEDIQVAQSMTNYDECGKTKTCIGLPSGCIEQEDCVSFGAVIVYNGTFLFEMWTSDDNVYIALALSVDDRMGDDSAIECVCSNGEVQTFTSFLGDVPRHSASRTESDQSIINLRESRIENNAFYCLVERDAVSQIGNLTFDLDNEAYHLLIASGKSVTETGLSYHGRDSREASAAPILFVELPEDTTTITTEDTTEITSEPQEVGIYDGCGKSKTCFGLPNGCIGSESCDLFGAVIVERGTYTFEMLSSSGAAYIAMALSNDDKMGVDSVIECVNSNGQVLVFTSVTVSNPEFGAVRDGVNQTIVRLQQSRLENDAIYCLVERDVISQINGVTFDLTSRAYFLMIASGTEKTSSSIGYHGPNRAVSALPILFEEDNAFVILPAPDSKVLVLIHGSFMIVAWIGTTSIGIFAAKHMKTLWEKKQFFGKQIWFLVHQVSMTLTWLLTIVAVTIIFIEVGELKPTVHSILGIITTSLCFIQPFLAFFRPAPVSETRPIFNFVHGSIGKLAQLLALITIYSSTSLLRVDFPGWTKFVLVSFIALYLFFHGASMILELLSDIKKSRMSTSLKEAHRSRLEVASLESIRKFIFILFLIVVVGFVVVLVNAVTWL